MRTKLIAVGVVAWLFAGCASLTPERLSVLAAIAGSAAELGAAAWLEEHPTHRDSFRLVLQALTGVLAESGGPGTMEKAVDRLNSLPTSTLAGPAGELYVTENHLVVWDASQGKAEAVTGTALKPVLEATRAGLKRAMEKKPMLLPIPPAPTAGKPSGVGL